MWEKEGGKGRERGKTTRKKEKRGKSERNIHIKIQKDKQKCS